jgi:hypothetical protein
VSGNRRICARERVARNARAKPEFGSRPIIHEREPSCWHRPAVASTMARSLPVQPATSNQETWHRPQLSAGGAVMASARHWKETADAPLPAARHWFERNGVVAKAPEQDPSANETRVPLRPSSAHHT